jgi:hypothetical protein
MTDVQALDSLPWIKRPEFYATISVIVFIALNIYFW